MKWTKVDVEREHFPASFLGEVCFREEGTDYPRYRIVACGINGGHGWCDTASIDISRKDGALHSWHYHGLPISLIRHVAEWVASLKIAEG